MLRLRQSRGINSRYIIPIWLCDTGLNLPLTNYWLDRAGDLWLNDQGRYIATIITSWMKLQTCVCRNMCGTHVTPFSWPDVLLPSCLRQYCVEKNTHSHSDASVKGARLPIHQARVHQSQSSLSPFDFTPFSRRALDLSVRRLQSGTGKRADSKLMTAMA